MTQVDGVQIVLKNYRCFPDSHPARIEIRRGFTSFLGANNSGKSTILRSLYELRQLFWALCDPRQLQQFLAGARGTLSWPWPVTDPTEPFSKTNDRSLTLELSVVPTPAETTEVEAVVGCTVTLDRNQSFEVALRTHNRVLPPMGLAVEGDLLTGPSPPVFVGPLLEACQALRDAMYVGPFRNAVNIGGTSNYYDIQIGQAFIQQWQQIKVGPRRTENEATVRLARDIRHIFGFESLEINATPDYDTLQLLINERSYRLWEVGAGINHFVLVLANVATRNPSFVLIDEPELNLHPSLQLDFLTTVASYSRWGCLFATHTVGLARAAADRIYSLRREAEGESRIGDFERTARLAEFVGELSFAGYRDMGFGSVLLVEGPTEVKTFQQFLRKLGKDHQVVLLPLGGASMISPDREAELAEVVRLTDRAYCLIDSEREVPGGEVDPTRTAFIDVCNRLGIVARAVDLRATENYFTDRAVKATLGHKYRALQPYEPLSSVEPRWSKVDNWRIAREMTQPEFEQTDIYEFVSTI